MTAFVITSKTVLLGTAWTGTAPGLPGTQTVSGTITSTSDISAYIQGGGEQGFNVNMVDGTNLASGGYKIQYPGLKSGDDLVFDLIASYTAAEINAIVQTTLGGIGSLVYADIKATSASRTATNPSTVIAAYISSYKPLLGGEGDLAKASLTLTVQGKWADLTS